MMEKKTTKHQEASPQHRVLTLVSDPETFNRLQHALREDFEFEWIKDGLELSDHRFSQSFDLIFSCADFYHLTPKDVVAIRDLHFPNTPLLFGIRKTHDGQHDFALWALRNHVDGLVDMSSPSDDASGERLSQQIRSIISVRTAQGMEVISEQDLGHIYNMLRPHYYSVYEILLFIKNRGMSVDEVISEVQKKAQVGTCLFDYIGALKRGHVA